MVTFSDYAVVETGVDITPHEIFNECSESECQELADILFKNGFYPTLDSTENQSYFSGGTSYTEQELATTLVKIWECRNLLNPLQLNRIHTITKESYV